MVSVKVYRPVYLFDYKYNRASLEMGQEFYGYHQRIRSYNPIFVLKDENYHPFLN